MTDGHPAHFTSARADRGAMVDVSKQYTSMASSLINDKMQEDYSPDSKFSKHCAMDMKGEEDAID